MVPTADEIRGILRRIEDLDHRDAHGYDGCGCSCCGDAVALLEAARWAPEMLAHLRANADSFEDMRQVNALLGRDMMAEAAMVARDANLALLARIDGLT